jgi:hypothetical protein
MRNLDIFILNFIGDSNNLLLLALNYRIFNFIFPIILKNIINDDLLFNLFSNKTIKFDTISETLNQYLYQCRIRQAEDKNLNLMNEDVNFIVNGLRESEIIHRELTPIQKKILCNLLYLCTTNNTEMTPGNKFIPRLRYHALKDPIFPYYDAQRPSFTLYPLNFQTLHMDRSFPNLDQLVLIKQIDVEPGWTLEVEKRAPIERNSYPKFYPKEDSLRTYLEISLSNINKSNRNGEQLTLDDVLVTYFKKQRLILGDGKTELISTKDPRVAEG